MTRTAIPRLALSAALLTAFALAGCSAGPTTASGPDAAATSAITSCGAESMSSSYGDDVEVSDVTVLYDPALTAVEPFCGQEYTTSGGKKLWVYYYAGGDAEATTLEDALVGAGWTLDSEHFLTLTESNGNYRQINVRVIEDATADSLSGYFLEVPTDLQGSDLVAIQLG